MHLTFHTIRPITIALCCAGLLAPTAHARQTSIRGSLSTGMNVRDRSYDQDYTGSTSNDQQKVFLSPSITISSQGIYDLLSFEYAPSFNYDFEDEDTSIDHNLKMNAERMLSSRWSITLSDHFSYSDDTTWSYANQNESQEEGEDESDITPSDSLSRDQVGRRYWTNRASIRSTYALGKNTSVNGGYTYSILRNASGSDGASYDEYDKHALSTDLAHTFDARWRSTLGLNYTRGLYDKQATTSSSSDLHQYGLSGGLDYILSTRNSFPLKYNYSLSDYDAAARRDMTSHELSFGWAHSFDPQTKFSIGGGPSYAETEGLDGELGYNAYLTLSKEFQHTFCSLRLSKQFETNNFSGTDESGIEDTYNAHFRLTHQYTQYLNFSTFARYSKQSQIDPQGIYQPGGTATQTGDKSYDKNIYEAGLGLKYSFNKTYSAGLQYSYYVSDGQLSSDQYDEHRIIFSLTMAKEFLRN